MLLYSLRLFVISIFVVLITACGGENKKISVDSFDISPSGQVDQEVLVTNVEGKKVAISPDGKTAYLYGWSPSQWSIVYIVNIEDSSKPIFIGSLDSEKSTDYIIDFSLSLDKTKLYVITSGAGVGCYIYDVRDFRNPKKLGKFVYGDGVAAKRVTISDDGEKLYIYSLEPGLFAIDITNSKNPTFIESFGAKVGSSDPTFLYLLGVDHPDVRSFQNRVISTNRNNAYEVDHNSLKIIDIFNQSILSELEIFGTPINIVLSNDENIAYVSTKNDGLVVIDISDSLNPKIMKKISVPRGAGGVAISPDGKTVYVPNIGNGLEIIELSVSDEDSLKSKINEIKRK